MTHEIVVFIAAILVFIASALSVAAAIGIVRFADVLTRLHAVTKPQVLGLFFIIIAVALFHGSWITFLMLTPVFIFQSLTAPISAHMVARAAYRADYIEKDRMFVDDLAETIAILDEEDEQAAK